MEIKRILLLIFFIISGLNLMAQSAKDLEKGKMYWDKAQIAYRQKNYSATFKFDKKSAELGYPRGMLSLGVCYLDGIGTQRDYDKAIYWYKKAMEHPEDSWSYPRSFFNLAYLYLKDWGVQKDINKAAQLYAEGVNNLKDDFEHYYNNFKGNYAYYIKDYKIKDYKDLAYVADFFETKGFGKKTNSYPFKRSFEMRSEFAIEKVKALVAEGNKEASVAWGIYLYNDRGTSQDKATAVSLWEKSSDNNLAQDMLIVAKGDGLYDKDIAKEWYMQENHSSELYAAAEKGNVEAQFTRAIEYDLKNNGVRMDWYEKASAQGHELATKRLADLKKEQAAAELEAKKQREIAAKQEAERKARDLALKKNSEGKQITWTETVSYDIGSGGLGQALLDAFGGSALHQVKYTIRYTGIVEKVIAGESVKCIIKRADIESPGLASANWVKYKKYAQSDAAENVGRTRVLDMNEFQLK